MSSPQDVAANCSQLHGSRSDLKILWRFSMLEPIFAFNWCCFNFQGPFVLFSSSSSLFFTWFPHRYLPWMVRLDLNGPSSCFRMVHLDPLFTGSCCFWRVHHLSLTSPDRQLDFSFPSCPSVEVPVFFLSSSFSVSIERQELVHQLVFLPAWSLVWILCWFPQC